jgi:hypothetical protein
MIYMISLTNYSAAVQTERSIPMIPQEPTRFTVNSLDVPAKKVARRIHVMTEIGRSRSTSGIGAISSDSGPNGQQPETPRYLKRRRGKWRYEPSADMKAAGLFYIQFGRVLTKADIDRVNGLNKEWDEVRRRKAATPERTLAWGYRKILVVRIKERRLMGKEPDGRWNDWPRFWYFAGPKFGRRDPRTITAEELLDFRIEIAATVGERDAYAVIKTWRALWKRMGTLICTDGEPLCNGAADPTKTWTYGNPAPPPRTEIWLAHQVYLLIVTAWDHGYHGLACAIAVAWDTLLSPCDVRSLTLAQLRYAGDGGLYFQTARAKTGQAATGTLSPGTTELFQRYVSGLGAELKINVPIFRTRGNVPVSRPGKPGEHGGDHGGGANIGSRPYTLNSLSHDFREVRKLAFGPEEKRQLRDMRRSGAVEAFAGEATPAQVSEKMANTLSHSNVLHKTYNPNDVAKVRMADEARLVGRRRLAAQAKSNVTGYQALMEWTNPPPNAAPERREHTESEAERFDH